MQISEDRNNTATYVNANTLGNSFFLADLLEAIGGEGGTGGLRITRFGYFRVNNADADLAARFAEAEKRLNANPNDAAIKTEFEVISTAYHAKDAKNATVCAVFAGADGVELPTQMAVKAIMRSSFTDRNGKSVAVTGQVNTLIRNYIVRHSSQSDGAIIGTLTPAICGKELKVTISRYPARSKAGNDYTAAAINFNFANEADFNLAKQILSV